MRSVAGRTTFAFVFPSFPPSTHLARRILVPTALAYIKPLAWPRQRQAIVAHIFSLSLRLCAPILTQQLDDKLSHHAVVRLSDLAFYAIASRPARISPQALSYARYGFPFARSRNFRDRGIISIFPSFLLPNSQAWINHRYLPWLPCG